MTYNELQNKLEWLKEQEQEVRRRMQEIEDSGFIFVKKTDASLIKNNAYPHTSIKTEKYFYVLPEHPVYSELQKLYELCEVE